MKKYLAVSLLGLFCFCVACNNNTGGVSATAQKNLDAMHGVINCFDNNDFSKLGDYIAENAVDHAGEQGDVTGLANMKTEFEKMSAKWDSEKTEIVKELADDEYVMSWLHFKGTMKVDDMGYKAGDKFDMNAIEVAKMKDGKVIEHWTFTNPAEMAEMMMKSMQQMSGSDTTNTKM